MQKNIVLKKIKFRYLTNRKNELRKIYKNLLEIYLFLKSIIDYEDLDLRNFSKEEILKKIQEQDLWLQRNKPKCFIFEKQESFILIIKNLKEYIKFLLSISKIEKLKPCTDKPLRKYQIKTVTFLQKITKMFEENNLKYFLLGGTLIGALRHQGFVPWDDDIDIGMMREDYERLKEILKEKAVPVDTSRIFVSKSNMQKEVNNVLKKNHNKLVYMFGPKYTQIYCGTSLRDCVYIDIFPHEYYDDSYTLKEHNDYVKKMNSEYIKRDNFKDIVEFFQKERNTNKNVVAKSNTIYYGVDSFVNYTIMHKKFMTKDMIFPLKKMNFENEEFYIPNKPEEYISIEYPTYLEFPSEIEIAPEFREHLKY
jgi:lipopolysaccharide cholinephosphotransferase